MCDFHYLMRRPMTRSKGKALTRARKQVQEGDEELAKLLAQASELDHTIDTTEARIVELEVRVGGCRTDDRVPELFSQPTARHKSGCKIKKMFAPRAKDIESFGPLHSPRSHKSFMMRSIDHPNRGTADAVFLHFRACTQGAPELRSPGGDRDGEGDGEGLTKREELLRELSALEDGPLPELERSVAERKHLLAQSGRLLDKLVADLGAARLELERREGAAIASQKEQKALQERIKEVKEMRG